MLIYREVPMFRIRGIAVILILLACGMSAAMAQQRIVPRLSHSVSPHRSAQLERRAALPDTVRMLAVMVDFVKDEDERTSGDGSFGSIYQYDYGTEVLDPMPHDRAHFQHHVRFLENYVRKVSGRKTILLGTVLDGIVTMDKPIGDYSFRGEESEAPVAQLAVDAWTKAGTQFAQTDFGDYDMFVVFHAGRGRDIDLVSLQGYDPTPLDIPSLSFTMESFQRLLGASFDGIAMPDGSRIDNCAVIPTTNNREIPLLDGSYGLLELTINGLLAASFGTWAGLPDLFDTETGKTGIGRFGLMDGEGIFAYGGICPPEPSAWEKQFLGWTVPREASPGRNNYLLTASDTLSTPDVLRIPITGEEYWLVENRQRDLGGNGQNITYVTGGQVQTVRFPKDTTGFSNGDVSQLKGVVIDVEDIDWALPGGRVITNDDEARINGGILIWHVDERVISDYRASNTVNTGDHVRGIDLEQAGGPQDIGVDIESVFGTETGTGSPLDFWSSDNISPLYTNSFSMFTAPNTRANSGAFSHVTVDNFSTSGPIMFLDVALGDNTIAPMPGWPVDLSETLHETRDVPTVQTADLDGDGVHEILITYASVSPDFSGSIPDNSAAGASIYAFRQDGTAFPPFDPSGIIAIPGTTQRMISRLTIGNWNGDNRVDMAMAVRDSALRSAAIVWIYTGMDGSRETLHRFDIRGDDSYLQSYPAEIGGKLLFRVSGPGADTMYVISDAVARHVLPAAATIDASLQIIDMQDGTALLTGSEHPVLFAVNDGSVSDPHMISRQGSMSAAPTIGAAGDVDGDGDIEAIVFGINGLVLASKPSDQAVSEASDLPSHGIDYGSYIHAAMADVDGDGRLDALFSGEKDLRALNLSLSSSDYYPAPQALRYCLSADLNTSGGHAVFGVGENRIWQFTTGARQANGFPVPLPHHADVALFPSAAGNLSIAAAAPDGRVYLFTTGTSVTEEQLIWRSRNGDERNHYSATGSFIAPPPIENFFPEERCYNWPNPVYDDVTYIRLYVSEDADVSIKIYDLAGDSVDEINAKAVGGTDNDIPWSVANIQSDVYIARIEATAGSKSGEKIIKIAVVK